MVFHLAATLRGIKRAKGLTVSQKKPIMAQILLALGILFGRVLWPTV